MKASNLPVSKVGQFSQLKSSYTKITLAKRKFKKKRDYVGFKNEICCMNLAYVAKLAKDRIKVKRLLVSQGLFDGVVDAKKNW